MLNAAQSTQELLNTIKKAFGENHHMLPPIFPGERYFADLQTKITKRNQQHVFQPDDKLIQLDVSRCIYVCNFCSEEIVFTIDPRPLRKHQAYECVGMPDDKLSEMQAAYKSVRKLSAYQLAMLAHMIKHGPTKSIFKSFEAFFSVNNELIVRLR